MIKLQDNIDGLSFENHVRIKNQKKVWFQNLNKTDEIKTIQSGAISYPLNSRSLNHIKVIDKKVKIY